MSIRTTRDITYRDDEQGTDDCDGHGPGFLWLELTLAVILGLLDIIKVREKGGMGCGSAWRTS